MPTPARYTLTLQCPDRTGIAAAVSGFTASFNGWIVEAAQHAEPGAGLFFLRQEILVNSVPFGVDELRERFQKEVATPLNMTWQIRDPAVPHRVVLMCSKPDHCITDLLHRWKTRDLKFDLRAVVSNHDDMRAVTEWHGARYYHVPVDKNDKQPAFDRVSAICDEQHAETVVLARYMQILPPALCEQYDGRMINIHHSFLPAFIGAKPYHQAHERGVKLIGATCHYVTAELDAGPIIEQDVCRVGHNHDPDELVRRGRDVERNVLSQGLRYHLEDRVMRYGNKTVVSSREQPRWCGLVEWVGRRERCRRGVRR